jgi:hypothetical protein
VRTIKKRGFNEKAITTLQWGRNRADCLSDCRLNKQRLINSLEGEVDESTASVVPLLTGYRTKFRGFFEEAYLFGSPALAVD